MNDSPLSPMSASGRPKSAGRVSTPTSPRLHAFPQQKYGAPHAAPPIPPKSILRRNDSQTSLSQGANVTPPLGVDQRHSFDTSRTTRTGPPAYEWVPAAGVIDDEDRGPVEGEKLAALRRAGGYKRPGRSRGGWLRLGLIILAVLLLIALIVGLAVGLTVGRRRSNNVQPPPQNETTPEPQPFPLGQYGIVTALRSVTTGCTSNPATWNCFPYQIFQSTTSDAGRTAFNWVISNSSSAYATVGTSPTPDNGIPANLTISSTNNPLTINFSDRPLTYISSASNSSSARYTFDFTMEKAFNPPVSLSGDNTATQCFFNQTTFSGTLYLSAESNYPADNSTSDAVQWPYAIEIAQTSPGGQDVPACYQYTDGQVGARLTTALVPQSVDAQCRCEYRNF